jgi:hypothetical protein
MDTSTGEERKTGRISTDYQQCQWETAEPRGLSSIPGWGINSWELFGGRFGNGNQKSKTIHTLWLNNSTSRKMHPKRLNHKSIY